MNSQRYKLIRDSDPTGSRSKTPYTAGNVGELIPSPSDDPIILRFANDDRNVFWLKDVIEMPSDTPLTAPEIPCYKKSIRKISQKSLRVYRAIFEALQGLDDWISTSNLIKRLDSDFSYVSINYVLGSDDKNQYRSMLALNLVERINSRKPRNQYHWRLTEYGRYYGEQIIDELS